METEELIKIIIGIVVIVVIGVGVSIFFKEQVIDFFKGFTGGKQAGIFISLIK